jgi:GTP-binding protein
MLTGWSRLAKISGEPGKTRTINHFLINDSWHLVDLPGYGYAKVPVKLREKWEKNTREYIMKRENLVSLSCLSIQGLNLRDPTLISWSILG